MKTIGKLSALSAFCALFVLTGCNQDKAAQAPAADPAPAAVTAEAPAVEAPAVDEEKPFIVVSNEIDATARVAAIDHATRDVVLTLENGEERAFTVSEEAQNLDQVAVGDLVTIAFFESLTIEVVSGENLEAGDAALAAAARTEEGEMPGGVMSQTDVEVFIVEAINLSANTFVLRNADGDVKEFTAHNPENLQRSAVGDAVVISMTKAIAVNVTKAQGAE